MRPRRGRANPGFTLVELLVVIGIIALLISILLPSLSKAREAANAIKCQSNQRQIMMAFLTFANDHKGHLPGNWVDGSNTDPEKRAWLRNNNEPFENAPQNGTIYRYLNTMDVYRCPSLHHEVTGAGGGSNGRFDYASFMVFTGAKVTQVRPHARFTYPAGAPDNGRVEELPTPIVCEEDPQGGVNGGNMEGGHSNTDRLGHAHRGGGYYATIDGSVHFFKEPPGGDARSWTGLAPRKGWTTLGASGSAVKWGYWGR